MDLAGRVCLITGGTSGIGAAAAIAFANKGASLALASGSGRVPEELAATLGKTSSAFHAVQADVADPRSCEQSVEEAVKRFGRLDVLVNSAGGPAPGGLDQVTEEAWMSAFAVHVTPRMAGRGHSQ